MKPLSLIVISAILVLSSPASAETAPETTSNGPGDAAKGEQIAAQVCAACHNADGNSIIPINPSLAGQHAAYLAKQLNDFKAQGDKQPNRASPVMGAMVAPLSSEDMRNLAAYYSRQVPKPLGAKNKELAEEGENI